LAKEKLKYFKFEGKQVRLLSYDPELRGDNKAKVMSRNVFYKFSKDFPREEITYELIIETFSKFGPIKSAKISINPDYSVRGFAFVCF